MKNTEYGGVTYHADHLKTKEVFKSLFSKKVKDWEILYDRIKAKQKKELEEQAKNKK